MPSKLAQSCPISQDVLPAGPRARLRARTLDRRSARRVIPQRRIERQGGTCALSHTSTGCKWYWAFFAHTSAGSPECSRACKFDAPATSTVKVRTTNGRPQERPQVRTKMQLVSAFEPGLTTPLPPSTGVANPHARNRPFLASHNDGFAMGVVPRIDLQRSQVTK